MVRSNGISIFYLSVGSGHQIAAYALADALKRELPGYSIRVVDPFANSVEILPTVLERLQAASILLTPGIYDSMWRRSAPGNLFERITELSMLQELLVDELSKNQSETVVGTHVLPCALSVALKQQSGLVRDSFGVVTDFGVHPYWPIEGVDGYFVGHGELKNQMIYRGIDANSIHVTGVPIRLDYEKMLEKEPAKDRDKLSVLLVVGGVRAGSYIEVQQFIFSLLDVIQESALQNLRLTIVTGTQKRLQKKLEAYVSKVSLDVTVLGFVDQMCEVMRQHDILIGKPGGLIVSEALASGLSFIPIKPGPGQENANVEFLARHRVAFRGTTPEEVVQVLKRFIEEPSQLRKSKLRAKALGYPDAASRVARRILEKLSLLSEN
jgi:processive 1,2-diacylglycerol beta-glucosyltransferase